MRSSSLRTEAERRMLLLMYYSFFARTGASHLLDRAPGSVPRSGRSPIPPELSEASQGQAMNLSSSGAPKPDGLDELHGCGDPGRSRQHASWSGPREMRHAKPKNPATLTEFVLRPSASRRWMGAETWGCPISAWWGGAMLLPGGSRRACRPAIDQVWTRRWNIIDTSGLRVATAEHLLHVAAKIREWQSGSNSSKTRNHQFEKSEGGEAVRRDDVPD